MKILRKKSVKIVIYVILGYLIATWGVNHMLNPVVYVQNIVNRNQHELTMEIKEDAIVIYPAESLQEFPYVSFNMDCPEAYLIRAEMFADTETETISYGEFTLENGNNSMKIVTADVKCIRLVSKEIGKYIPEITNVRQAPYAKVNLLKTLEIALSFIAIILFWEGLQYIRTKYTVS